MYISKDTSSIPKTDFFDMDYNHLDFHMKDPNSNPDELPKCPSAFNEMKMIASELSKNIPHLRVDFYIVGSSVYIGELTLYHMSGFSKIEPDEWNYRLGSWIKLPD